MRRLILLSLLLLPLGCGGPYKTAPVSGKVTLNGEPLAHVAITFQPVATEGNNEPGPGSGAFTDAQGRYTLKLVVNEKNGGVVGKNKVRITVTPETVITNPKGLKELPDRYNRNTELEFDVPSGGTSSADFALTAP